MTICVTKVQKIPKIKSDLLQNKQRNVFTFILSLGACQWSSATCDYQEDLFDWAAFSKYSPIQP